LQALGVGLTKREQNTNIGHSRHEKSLKWNDLQRSGFSASTKEQTMTAAIATIVFLSAAWFAIVAMAHSFEGQLAKIGAALNGKPQRAFVPIEGRLTVRYQPVRQPRVRIRQQLRAAA
jgi:hypothetical protein